MLCGEVISVSVAVSANAFRSTFIASSLTNIQSVLKVTLPRVYSFTPLFNLKYINNTIQNDEEGLQKLFKLLSSTFNAHLMSSGNNNSVFR
jgi:hypothetical protein